MRYHDMLQIILDPLPRHAAPPVLFRPIHGQPWQRSLWIRGWVEQVKVWIVSVRGCMKDGHELFGCRLNVRVTGPICAFAQNSWSRVSDALAEIDWDPGCVGVPGRRIIIPLLVAFITDVGVGSRSHLVWHSGRFQGEVELQIPLLNLQARMWWNWILSLSL